MSNNKSYQRYLELYSKYVESRVALHNYHIQFGEYMGARSYYSLREHIRALPALEKELVKVAKLAMLEQKEIAKAEKTEKKLARHKKKLKNNVDVSGGISSITTR